MVWHLIRMVLRRLPLEVFWAPERPKTRWREYISCLAWVRHWVIQEELESVAGEKEAWKTLLSLLLIRPNL